MNTFRNLLLSAAILFLVFRGSQLSGQSVKGQNIRPHTISLSGKKSPPADTAYKIQVQFLALLPYDQSDEEVRAAWDFLSGQKTIKPVFLTAKEFIRNKKGAGPGQVLWIHRPDREPFQSESRDPKLMEAIRSFLSTGGNLLLTQQAVHFLNVLGIESETFQDSIKTCADDGYGRKLGFHAFRSHPVFKGLNGGAYIQRPERDQSALLTGFFGPRLPAKGKVVAVDWDYIFVREGSKLILEYETGKGKILAVGGYMNFSWPNLNSLQLGLFTRNCFDYLVSILPQDSTRHWEYTPNTVIPCNLTKPETDQLLVAVPEAEGWPLEVDPLMMERIPGENDFWDVAGERMLTMGKECGGVEEVWAHPFMAFRDYEAGIRLSGSDTIIWLSSKKPRIGVYPSYFCRHYEFDGIRLREIIVNDPEEPAGVIHYEYEGSGNVSLVIRFSTNFRWMWPYSGEVTGSICHSWDMDLHAFNFRDKSGDLNLMIGGSRRPVEYLSGQYNGFETGQISGKFHGISTDQFMASGLLHYELNRKDNLDIVFVASADGYPSTLTYYDRIIHNPRSLQERAIVHARQVLDSSLIISTPDPGFNKGYQWALLATDRFFVNTPGMGKALVAGYSTTRFGWDGGQKVNGRPGYGWYFGRDAEWSSFALLDYGDFSKVRSQLEFFNKYQDLTGKIFHEASTSGFIHYDAADATPLYIVLAGKYFRHSGDTAFILKTWPNIRKALRFCFSTDTDNDRLIENTNVGHGWVEGGELYGSHATIYMNGIWASALSEAAIMGTLSGDPDAPTYRPESREVRKRINNGFWDKTGGFYAYGLNKDGSFRKEPTILPAVPLYFRLADQEKAKAVLNQYAVNAFSTAWGTRIIREDSPLFKPTGYHYGSVWPLFTGWTALAEYAYGNYNQGFMHLMNNLNVYKTWGLGFVEEVLNGSEYKPSGVCAHQCWSETMVLQPAIEGLLGMEVKAYENKIILSPHFPANWDSARAGGIRMADTRIGFKFVRNGGVYRYVFDIHGTKPVDLDFMPSLPAGVMVNSMILDGQKVDGSIFRTEQWTSIMVRLHLTKSCTLEIGTSGGIAVIPLLSDPKPGAKAEGIRIITHRLTGDEYIIELEGKTGSGGFVEVYSDGREIAGVVNGSIAGREGLITKIGVEFNQGTTKYVVKQLHLKLQ
jgi:glycogen debranching enzyme